eukprot:CAMPEP_0170622162 /NCGR_PEP_ID=MMETSP0224-20130122/28980_1 /TAXON_ID=285029 /ORGANISM="Togula jolla, Strain CCCM 725" /LENGTH=99 /DNA_ID=CAMNT_0010948455 /DNA_START=52 /DNA_END=348 /DNA_ORIENTATION=+
MGKPGESAHLGPRQPALRSRIQTAAGTSPAPQLTASFSFFRGRARTVCDAGFALKMQGSFVKGLMPFLALVAGFFFSFMLSIPASLKLPVFFSSLAHKA